MEDIDGSKGGSNAIFGVDGSPVVHDVFMKGLTPEGNVEGMIKVGIVYYLFRLEEVEPGFSVLDVTNPDSKRWMQDQYTCSLFIMITINNIVYIADL